MELCLAWMTIKMWIVAVKMPFFLLAHIMFPEQVREKRKEMHLQGIKTLFLHEISRGSLFLYRVHVFRTSVTGMPFLFVCFFFITFCSR